MAASVFASMLGVASTAPNFPPTSGVPYQQPVQPGRVEQMTLSGVSGIAAMHGQGGMSMAGIGNQGGTNMGGMPGGQGAQSMPGIPGGSGVYSMPGGQGAQSMPGIPGGQDIQSMSGIPGSQDIQSMGSMLGGVGGQNMGGNAYRNPTAPSGPNAAGAAREEKNVKKRGLFGALLDWLSR